MHLSTDLRVLSSSRLSLSYCVWNEFNAFAYSTSAASLVLSATVSTSYRIWNEFNAFAYSFSTVHVVRLSTIISISYSIWNEFNAFAYSFSTTNLLLSTTVSTSYVISNGFNPLADSFSSLLANLFSPFQLYHIHVASTFFFSFSSSGIKSSQVSYLFSLPSPIWLSNSTFAHSIFTNKLIHRFIRSYSSNETNTRIMCCVQACV